MTDPIGVAPRDLDSPLRQYLGSFDHRPSAVSAPCLQSYGARPARRLRPSPLSADRFSYTYFFSLMDGRQREMELPGISRKIVGMCYNVKKGTSTFTRTDSSITLRVPFIAQKHVNLCSDATAAMIVEAWGFKLKSGKMANTRGAFTGSSVEAHTGIAEAGECYWRSLKAPKNFAADWLVDLLFQYGPLGAGVKSVLGGHCVAVIGAYANNNEVIIHDPWTGPFKMRKFADFKNKLTELTWLEKVGSTKMEDASSPWMS